MAIRYRVGACRVLPTPQPFIRRNSHARKFENSLSRRGQASPLLGQACNLFLAGRCGLSPLPDCARFPAQGLAFPTRCTAPTAKPLGRLGFRDSVTTHWPSIILSLPADIVECNRPRYQPDYCASLVYFSPTRTFS